MPGGRLFLPLILIAVGAAALLANFGLLEVGSLWRLGELWPLVLIVAGLEIVIGRLAPRPLAAPAGLAVLVLALAGAIAYAAAVPASVPAGSIDSSAPAAGVSAGHLEIDAAAARITLSTGSTGSRLYRAHIDYPPGAGLPSVSFDPGSGRVRVESRQGGGFSFFDLGSGREDVRLTLSDRVPWTVTVNGAAIDGSADLRAGSVSGIMLSSAAGRFSFTLPLPSGRVPVDVSGAAFKAEFHLASGVEASVRDSGAAASVDAFGHRFGGFGEQSWSSPGYASAADRYDIQVSGAASSVSLDNG